MIPTELMPNAKKVITATAATWEFTVDVSGIITGSGNAKAGDYLIVKNAPGASFIGNIYATCLINQTYQDQTYQLVGSDSMKADTPYVIQSEKGDYYLTTGNAGFLAITPDAGTSGTLHVGDGGAG